MKVPEKKPITEKDFQTTEDSFVLMRTLSRGFDRVAHGLSYTLNLLWQQLYNLQSLEDETTDGILLKLLILNWTLEQKKRSSQG